MPDKFAKVSAACGIAAPLVMVGLWIVASFLRPGYNQLTQRGSELGVGQNSIVMNANFVVTGILMVTFGVGLGRSWKQSTLSRISLGFFLVSGFTEAITGLFPCDPGCPPSFGSISQNIHLAIGILFFGSIAISPLLVGVGFRDDPFWRRYYSYSIASGAASLGLYVLFSVAVLTVFQYIGLVQRVFLAFPFQWVGITANHLRHYPSSQ